MVCESSDCSASVLTFDFVSLINFNPCGCVLVSLFLTGIFLMNNDVEHLCILAIHISLVKFCSHPL